MKFAEKYEIIEMLTSGRVSTFLARDRATQESVVVYTFECVGSAAELSTASIIARFCALAPNPPGIIVKAGFDEPSSSAFLTTKMPDSAALKQWAGAYHAFPQKNASPAAEPMRGPSPVSDETAELSASELKAALAQRGRPQSPPADDPGEGTAAFSLGSPTSGLPQLSGSPPSGGEFTRLFREVNAFEPLRGGGTPAARQTGDATDAMFGPKAGSVFPTDYKSPPPSPPTPKPTPPTSAPGSFTKEFLGLANDGSTSGSQVIPPAPPKKEPGAFTKEFLAASQQSDVTPNEPAIAPASPIFGSALRPDSSSEPGLSQRSSESPKGGTGEFTKFFGSPFDQPGTPEKSFEVPDLATSEPVKPQTGDFTRMFGRDDMPSVEDRSPLSQEPEPSPGSLTQLLSESAAGKHGAKLGSFPLDTNPGVRPSPVSSAPPVSPQFQQNGPVLPPPDFSPPRPAPPVTPAVDRPLASSTEIFRPARIDAPPVEPIASGPSDFTMFIDRSRLGASLPPEPSAPGSGVGGGMQPPVFAPPPIPQPPPFQFAPPPPKPAMPAFPPVPPLPAVKPPVPAPAMPQAPAKAASYWPLITVLTILVAIGALLVMYFVLRPH